MAKSKNIFVLDTCVLLHDPNCIYKFEEHDLFIPLACIDDLDEIKTRKDSTGWAAREVFRNLDKYDILQITKGVVVNEFGGKLYLYNNEAPLQRGEKPAIVRVNSDNAIIDAAMSLKAENTKRKVIIVSKDTGLRVRAVSWGCLAENYRNDLLGDDKTFDGYRIVDIVSLEDWEYLNQRKTCDIDKLDCKDGLKNLNPNEFICFKFGNQSVFAWYKNREIIFLDEKKKKEAYMGIVAKNMEQRFALEALSDDNIPLVCLNGPAGSGKAQPLNSLLLTPNGYIKMGEVKLGDKICGSDGEFHNVTGVFPQGTKDVVKIIFSDGSEVECCKEHLWNTKTDLERNDRKFNQNYTTKNTEEIMNSLLAHDGRKNHTIPLISAVKFEQKYLPINPYVLGVLLGGGSISQQSVVVSTQDIEILDLIKERLEEHCEIEKIKNSNCDYRIVCGSVKENILSNKLSELKLKNTKFIPQEYKFGSINQRLEVLQGLLDTDGYVSKSGSIYFYTVSDQLSSDVIEIVNSLGGIVKSTVKYPKCTYNGLQKDGQKCNVLCISLPDEFVPFKLERKIKLVRNRAEYPLTRYICDVIEIGQKECQCISVDSPDHLYVTDDFILTHNTLCAIAVGLEKVKNGQYDRIIVMKPLIAVGGKDIGFLPGSKFEKISAWLGPFKDNIIQLTSFNDYDKGGKFGGNNFEEMVEDGTIEVEAMAFIQGRSIPNSYIILDECLVADSLIYTGNGKLIKIQDIVDGEYVNSWNTSSNIFENNQISNKFNRTSDTIIRLSTSRGVIECSPTHKMWVYENGSSLIKKEVAKINLDDLIPCINETEHYVENDLSDSEATLLAMILAGGHITKSSNAIKIDMSKDQEWLKESFLYAIDGNFSKFTIDIKINAKKNMIAKINNPSEIKLFIKKHNLNCGKKTYKNEVPDMIWNAPISSVKKFIQACFDYKGDVQIQEQSNNAPQCVVSFVTCSKVFAYQMQGLLLKFGIESTIYDIPQGDNHNSCYKVSIVGGYMCKKYGQKIGFSIQSNQNQLEYIYNFDYNCPNIYPKVIALDLYNSLVDNGRLEDKNHYFKSDMINDLGGDKIDLNDGPGISHNTFQKVQLIADKLNYALKNVVACSKINSITLLEEPAEVFDFEVANNHTFIVNGLVSSNCENVSPKEARMVVERCGKNSKVVLLGDMSQIENPYLDKQSCGLAHAINGGKAHEVAASVAMHKVERSALSAAASQIFNVKK